MRLGEAEMVFHYADSFNSMHALEGYERLILDAMLGDQSLFTRSDGIERLWEVIRPAAGEPAAGRAVRTGLLGPRVGRPAHRALPLEPAGRSLTPASDPVRPGPVPGRARGCSG